MNNEPYRMLSREEFSDLHYKLVPWISRPEEDIWGDYSYLLFIFRYEKDIPVEFIGSDGGEIEDQTLKRDWSWVVPALNREAYREK